MKKTLTIIALMVLISGCSAKSWKYSSDAKIYKQAEIEATLVVPPLKDSRKNKNSMSGYFVAMIPLVPYGTSYFNIPEASPYLPFKPIEDFSKATAEELNNASIFKNTFFSNNTYDGDLVLQGNLIKSKYSISNTFYGLSLPGDLLWLIGFPSGKIKNEIKVEYRLIDNEYNIYFQKTYKASSSSYQWLYYNVTNFQFEDLLKEINLQLIDDFKKNTQNIKNRIPIR